MSNPQNHPEGVEGEMERLNTTRPITRRTLPDRRQNVTQKFHIYTKDGPVPLYCTCGLYEDGALGEIFMSFGSGGSDDRAWIDTTARSVSVGLQNGVALCKYVDMFTGVKMEASGAVLGYERIKFCSSPLDLVFRWLGIEFLGMKELGVNIPEVTNE